MINFCIVENDVDELNDNGWWCCSWCCW